MRKSKAVILAHSFLGKILSFIGYCLGIIGLIGVSFEISYIGISYSGMILALVFVAVGFSLILAGGKIKRRIKRFKKYVSLISGQNISSLDSLASLTGKSITYIKDDINSMIITGYFSHAVIDNAANTICINPNAAKDNIPNQFTTTVTATVISKTQTEAQPEIETYICKGCSARGTKYKGVLCTCDYCDTPII